MMRLPSLRFLGAVDTVTGSRFLLDSGGSQVLVDAGLYQGPKPLRLRNWDPLPFDVHRLDAVVLTHAHLDHCGYLPVLRHRGFRGPVFATASTIALANIVLPDAGRLQEEEAEQANRHGYSRHDPALPLFTEEDALAVAKQFRDVPFDASHPIGAEFRAVLRPAGHILGAASVTLTHGATGRTVGFSGDLGRSSHPLLRPPAPRDECDLLLIESTYGDRVHEDLGLDRLADAIRRTCARGGTVVIPAFAVDRTELVLHAIAQLQRSGAIPNVPVIVDSPMALATLAVYRAALRTGSAELRPEVVNGGDPFAIDDLTEASSVEESKDATARSDSAIVISASGMATGGRVLHHLVRRLPDESSCVILVGYQAQGTRGRDLAEGATELKIHGRYVPVRAEVVVIDAFSAHADADELVAWARTAAAPSTTFTVHGEPPACAALATRFRGLGWTTVDPEYGERVTL